MTESTHFKFKLRDLVKRSGDNRTYQIRCLQIEWWDTVWFDCNLTPSPRIRYYVSTDEPSEPGPVFQSNGWASESELSLIAEPLTIKEVLEKINAHRCVVEECEAAKLLEEIRQRGIVS